MNDLILIISQKVLKIEIDVFIIKNQLDEITVLLNQIKDVQNPLGKNKGSPKTKGKTNIN